MQSLRKKLILFIGLPIALIVVAFGIFAIASKLDNVSVTIRERVVSDETNLESGITQKVKNDGNFKIGKLLLFYDVSENIEIIEKKNPFVKVEQIIKTFPNTLTIYISERIPCAYMSSGEYYYLFDDEFKILAKVSNDTNITDELCPFNKYLETCYEIKNVNLPQGADLGDFIKNNDFDKLKTINSGIVGALRSLSSVKTIEIGQNSYSITMKKPLANEDGTKIVIENFESIKEQTFVALKFYETIDRTQDAVVIKVQKGIDGKYIAKIEETN